MRKELSLDERIGISSKLNEFMARGESAYDHLDLLRSLPNPIAIDFKGVLVDDDEGATVNPLAAASLQALRQVGTVIIVTGEESRYRILEELVRYQLWTDDMVLMALPNWDVHERSGGVRRNAMAAIEEYCAKSSMQFDPSDFLGRSQKKSVAPIFALPHPVPIIDDSFYVTNRNPGILGINVKSFTIDPDRRFATDVDLSQAAEIVAQHYASIEERQ